MNDIYKRGSCLSSWLRGTRYAVNDIYKRGGCRSSWLLSTRYAGSGIYKRGSCLSSWLRGTQLVATRYAVRCVIYTTEEVVLVAGYAVRSE